MRFDNELIGGAEIKSGRKTGFFYLTILLDSNLATHQRTGWLLTLKGPLDLSTCEEDVRSGSSPAGSSAESHQK